MSWYSGEPGKDYSSRREVGLYHHLNASRRTMVLWWTGGPVAEESRVENAFRSSDLNYVYVVAEERRGEVGLRTPPEVQTLNKFRTRDEAT